MASSLSRSTRRDFLKHSAVVAGAGVWWSALPQWTPAAAPNEKLNIAVIGPGGRGASNLGGVSSQNIVALCDVDGRKAKAAFERYPQAKKYEDFRKLLDSEKSLDAVVVSTPDHTHVPAAVDAMRRGLHCYCEKPLSHNVAEARLAAEVAAKHKVATQMGNQIHSGNNYRRVVELIQSGAIGDVEEAHVWVHKVWGGGEVPKDTPPVPEEVNWDLWLGPAAKRPYHPIYMPANWRRWWDFGSGTLGDMGCHYMDLPFWALKLRHPKTVSAEGPPVHASTAPKQLRVNYEFPAREGMPPVRLTWYDGASCPKELHGMPIRGDGVMFVGSKGQLFANYGSYKLMPEEKFADFKPPEPTIPNSIGHHAEWIKACQDGSPTGSNFDYAGALTESVLLGTVAYRAGETIQWDAEHLKATNCPLAEEFIHRTYRDGWKLT